MLVPKYQSIKICSSNGCAEPGDIITHSATNIVNVAG